MAPTEPVKQVTFGGPAEDKVVTCYKCGGRDHLAKGCIAPDELGIPRAKKRGATTQAEQTPAPTRGIKSSRVLWNEAAKEAVVAHDKINAGSG